MPQDYATADRPDLAPVEFEPVDTVARPTIDPAQARRDLATQPRPTGTAVAPHQPASVGVSLIQVLQAGLSDPNATPERLNQLFDFYERIAAVEARKAYDAALADAQAEFPPLHKNRRVFFKSKSAGGTDTDYRHEDLAEIVTKCGPILAKHGISYRWRTHNRINEPIEVTCILRHKLGHSEENTLIGPRDESGNKNGLQGIASTITYLERYTFKSSIGQASAHDDDGRAGGATPAEDAATIDEDQQIWLREALEHPAQDQEGFCKYFNVERLCDLPAFEFERAKTAIAGKLAAYNKGKR